MVDPNIWGKHGWKFIHYVAQGYPDEPENEDKEIYKNFFMNLGKILPCFKCRNNYYSHLKTNPINHTVLQSRENLEKWVVSIHNQVNQMNEKPVLDIDVAKSIHPKDDCVYPTSNEEDKINNIENNQVSNNKEFIAIISILIGVIFFFIIKKY